MLTDFSCNYTFVHFSASIFMAPYLHQFSAFVFSANIALYLHKIDAGTAPSRCPI